MGKKYLEKAWTGFRKDIIPADASDLQVSEMRKAFYSGATVLFEIIMRGLGPGEEPTAEDMTMMDDINAEMQEFGAALDREHLGGRSH